MKLSELKEKGWDLAYWQSGEWQVIEERLDEIDRSRARNAPPGADVHAPTLDRPALGQYNPDRSNLFAALLQCPFSSVKVAVLGQDPYPARRHCTGVAFSLPSSVEREDWPPTLVNLFREYSSDLGYPTPKNGDLTQWVKQGVLLWNVYPSCQTGRPASHHWTEWTYLTNEIVEKLDAKGVVFCVFGRVAQHFSDLVKSSPVLATSHPSPLGARFGFLGSKIFSRTNEALVHLGHQPIAWRLPDEV